ncbi:MAG: hypothetical protein IPJ88_01895 [Myxococcales bacterium]|nr:MAG: hypothetical protein IPJ88_01895 [Myxococcales bacterium]
MADIHRRTLFELRHILFVFALLASCVNGKVESLPTNTGTGTNDAGTNTPPEYHPSPVSAPELTQKLNRPANFLIGMGNDLSNDHNQDGIYSLGVTLDLHYAYLVGLSGQGGWPDWNEGGSFVNILADSADSHGVVPMFTTYSMAAWGEANLSVLTNDEYMQAYWNDTRLLFERLAIFDKPAVVHLEPDFWAYAQQQSSGNDPASLDAHVSSFDPLCSGLSDNLVGMVQCIIHLARSIAPKVVLGFHVSPWSGSTSDTIAFMKALGIQNGDFFVVETLDRDAGCFEAQAPECQRNDGPWYWDETNQSSPNFHEHLSWVSELSTAFDLPALWWQMPFGVPSDQEGGSPGQYRDNRVKYLFSHVQEFIDAGGVGAVFGTGAGNQTTIDTDGGQFKDAVSTYYETQIRYSSVSWSKDECGPYA